MKKFYILVPILSFACQVVSAQVKNVQNTTSSIGLFKSHQTYADLALQNNGTAKQNAHLPGYWYNDPATETGGSQQLNPLPPSTGIDYDVKYYRLELRINPDTGAGKYISGKVTTYFTTAAADFSQVNLDFATPLICDSVYYHGAKVTSGNISRPTDLLQITIPSIPTVGTLDSLSIYYEGVPPDVPAFGGGTGYVKAIHGTNQNYIYTLSEPYASYTWWPCKSFLVNDKADSLDLVVSTPAGFKVAGNGTRISETIIGTNLITYWKNRYPIAAYQVCVAVANYVQYPSTPTIVNIGGTNMPLYNYLFPETNTAIAEATLDKTALMLTTFSNKFGDYPFKNEKYGHYTFGFGGGMEHNTFSGMSAGTYNDAGDWSVIAHELGHQWFGAGVTCGSWHDIWINESFATFCESICAEFAPTVSAGQTGASWRGYHKSLAIDPGNQSQSVYVTDTTDIATIFTPAVYVYERGAIVIYMLRALLGDAKFFQAIQNYQADPLLKYRTALTDDVKRHMENVSGLNLTSFFNHWIYNTGFASYGAAKWNNDDTRITLQLSQTTQFSALSHFDMPVPIRIQGASGDTTVVVYDNNGIFYYDSGGVLTSAGSNMVQFNLSFVPDTVIFDPYNEVLATGSFTKDTLIILATDALVFTGRTDGANALLSWRIDRSARYPFFEIERSADGIHFKPIGSVKASDFPNRYAFTYTDVAMLPGIGYYRVKAIQQAGAVLYTKILPLMNATDKVYYSIMPNPARDYITIRANGGSEKVTIKIYDATGQLVRKSFRQFPVNGNTLKLPLYGLSAGSYYVEIRAGNKLRHTQQVVILK